MTRHFNRTSEKQKRRDLRNNMPPAEVRLWSKLKSRQLLGRKFQRQYSVDEYVIDFYCAELKLGIEIDGDSHFTEGAKEYDERRQRHIESYGIKLVRFLNTDVFENLDGVLEVLAREIQERTV